MRGNAEINTLISGAQPFTEADSTRSPAPPEQAWRVEL